MKLEKTVVIITLSINIVFFLLLLFSLGLCSVCGPSFRPYYALLLIPFLLLALWIRVKVPSKVGVAVFYAIIVLDMLLLFMLALPNS